MRVSVEKDEKSEHEPGPELRSGARSRHHVEEVMSRILAKLHTDTKRLTIGDADQESGETSDRRH
jgi:hypothetical protein